MVNQAILHAELKREYMYVLLHYTRLSIDQVEDKTSG